MPDPFVPVPPDAGLDAAEVLGCGVPLAELVDQADAGRLEPVGDHQVGCVLCRAVLRDATALDQALGLLRATSGAAPAGLVDRVMREVRGTRQETSLIELGPPGRHGQEPPGPPGPPGSEGPLPLAGGIRVQRQVIADVARTAVAGLRGVTVAQAAAASRPGGSGVDIALGLLVDGRTPLPELARTVRRAVRDAVGTVIGSQDIQVELTALDLLAGD